MRFVTPEVVRIPLNDGKDWIEVKKFLTAGEEKKYRTRGMKRVQATAGEQADKLVEVDWVDLSFARAEAYITDWSEKKDFSMGALKALHPEDFDAIDAAIKAHIEAMDEEKKLPSGSPTPTLPSP
jgi:hypothetical protein